MTILDQLADHARERVAYGKEKVAADEMRRRAFDLGREGWAVLHLRRLLRSLGSRLFVSVRRLLLLRD